jgi:23S rRNA (guanine2445-N2)-methyltransferase / 23S rRNA (guanine2069-N7)-methyltransferase
MLDPPSFSNSKATEASFDVERDQSELLAAAMSVLAPDGVMYFSTNRRGFQLAESIEGDYRVENISKVTIPPDFRRNTQIHQCWRITHCARS